MVTTALPGMPDEYYNYVFIFSEETIEGFATTLKRILALSEETLQWKGEKCKSFVMEKKNNIIQTKKVLNLFRRI
jgi:hypothetical protein